MVGGRLMRIKTALTALLLPLVLMLGACGEREGCYDDGERVSCGDWDDDDDDDREWDDEDDEDWGDDD